MNRVTASTQSVLGFVADGLALAGVSEDTGRILLAPERVLEERARRLIEQGQRPQPGPVDRRDGVTLSKGN